VEGSVAEEVVGITVDLDDDRPQVASLLPMEPLDVLTEYAIVLDALGVVSTTLFTTGSDGAIGMEVGTPTFEIHYMEADEYGDRSYRILIEGAFQGAADPDGLSYVELTDDADPQTVLTADFVGAMGGQSLLASFRADDAGERCFTVTQVDALGQRASSEPVCATPYPIEDKALGCSTVSPTLFSSALVSLFGVLLLGFRRRVR
jgi:hypothetical protein